MAFFGQKFKFIYFAFVEKNFTKVPLNTFFDKLITDAQTVTNFQRAFCKTNRATAKADLVVIINHHNWYIALGKINRGTKPTGPAPITTNG